MVKVARIYFESFPGRSHSTQMLYPSSTAGSLPYTEVLTSLLGGIFCCSQLKSVAVMSPAPEYYTHLTLQTIYSV